MSEVRLSQYHKAVLGFINGNKYGKRSDSKIYDEFVSELLDQDTVEQILEDLMQAGYVKPIEIEEQKVAFLEEMTGEHVSKEGHKITQLGKDQLNYSHPQTTVYNNIKNSNIAHESPQSNQSVHISELPEDIQHKLKDLQDAIHKKDSQGIKKAFAYIADKSVDVAIAILTGALIK